MWYEDGTIKYQLEAGDNSNSSDLGTVDNPYRLIKYVVVNPQRSGDEPMLELRLLQLSVTSNVRVPTEEAVEYTAPVKTAKQTSGDGTIEGLVSGLNRSWIDDLMSFAKDLITIFWTGFWPLLNFLINWYPWKYCTFYSYHN